MKTTLLMTLVCALAVVPAGANSNATVSQQLSTEARELKTLANDVAAQLKNKRADIAVAQSRLPEFTQKANEISRLIGEIEGSGLTLDSRRQQELDRLKKLSLTLNLFVENKKQMLDSGGATAQRNLLRSHAVGVATRADLIGKSVRKLGL
jgi:chromosome segregation ATPase